MAWKFRRPNSNHWWIGYYLNGKKHRRSTGTEDEAQADRELAKLRTIDQAHKSGSLTEEFFRLLTNKTAASDTLKGFAKQWLAECKDLSPNTLERYRTVIDEFCGHVKADDASPLLRDVRPESVAHFLRSVRTKTATTTTRLYRRILSAFFNYAVDNQVLQVSPVPSSKSLKLVKDRKDRKSARRSFTLDELKTLYQKAPDDFWRYMVLGGFYTALRMGDLIMMPWGAVDFEQDVIRLMTRKTGTPMNIPLRAEFRKILEKLRKAAGKVKPSDFIWPEQAARYERYRAKVFSNEFYDEVLLKAGLVVARTHKPKNREEGEKATGRQVNPVSFHCLRHTFVSLLKISGGSQAVAKELAGHSSDAVSDLYTHVPEEVLSKAIDKLPEVTK